MKWTRITTTIAADLQPLAVAQRLAGICKCVVESGSVEGVRFAVQLLPPSRATIERPRRGQQHLLAICIASELTPARAQALGELLINAHQATEANARNGVSPSTPRVWPGTHLTQVAGFLARRPTTNLVKLNFITPVSARALAFRNAGEIDASQFLAWVRRRYHHVTGCKAPIDLAPTPPSVFGHYALRTTAGHGEKSVRGPIFIANAADSLIAVLDLLQHFNWEGDGVNAWRGHFRMQWQSRPVLDTALLKVGAMTEVARHVMLKNDGAPMVNGCGAITTPAEVADRVCTSLSAGQYRFEPTQAFTIAKPMGGLRQVEQLTLPDHIALRRLHELLSVPLDKVFPPSAVGFRRGRGREDAIQMIRQAIASGYKYVCESDIHDFFPSINHHTLMADLGNAILPCDPTTRQLIGQAVAQPYLEASIMHTRTIGLSQGSPLSPLLANYYLRHLDASLTNDRDVVIRYADDLVILCRTRADAEAALARLVAELAGLGLRTAPEKTQIVAIEAGFSFLGERFSLRDVEPPLERVLAQRKPLVVTEPYIAFGANGDALEAKQGGRIMGTWPFRRLSEVILLSRASISTAAIEKCGKHGIPLSIAINNGKSMATLRPQNRAYHDIAFAHGLWHRALSDHDRLSLAQTIVRAKLNNYAQLVVQRRGAGSVVEGLRTAERSACAAATLEQLRGVEGAAARKVFAWLRSQFIATAQPVFKAARRERGAPDRLNSLLNFAYFLLFARMNGLVRAHGLNPYLGLLHDSAEDYETLVYDLIEPFRPFVDRMVIRMINRNELGSASFEPGGERYWLTREATQRIVRAFEESMREPLQGYVLGDIMNAQVRALRSASGGAGGMWLFRWQPQEKRLQPQGNASGVDVINPNDTNDAVDFTTHIDRTA